MYAQIDFNRESEHEIYTRVKFFNPMLQPFGFDLAAMSMEELYVSLSIKTDNLVSQSFLTKNERALLHDTFEQLFKVHGYGFYIRLNSENFELSGADLLDSIRLCVLDEEDQKDVPLAGTLIRKLTVDVQISD